jgi:hypothetical protein
MSEWKFRRRQGWCGGCERRFEEGERHASSLAVRGDELVREDLCEPCWSRSGARDELFHWFTRHRAAQRGLQLDLATLEQVFLSLAGRSEPRLAELAYLIALLLLRKRRLRLERVARDERGEAMLVRRPRRTESLRVQVFDFAPERLEALRGELARLFEGGEPALPSAGAGGGEAAAPEGEAEDGEPAAGGAWARTRP